MNNNNESAPEGSSHFLQVKGLWDVWQAIGRIVEPIIPTGNQNLRKDRYRVAGIVQDGTQSWWVALQQNDQLDNLLVPLGKFPTLFWEVQP